MARRAVFLDRDGVLNVKLPEDRYVTAPEEFEFLPGVFEALDILRSLGFLLVVITNQRGIARGLMSEEDLVAVHESMEKSMARKGLAFDAIYYCPHDRDAACRCRKPEPGMILAAIRDLNIDAAESYMVGDSPSDMEAGRRAGTRTVRVAPDADADADLVFPTLPAFAEYLRAVEALDPPGCDAGGHDLKNRQAKSDRG